MCPAPEMVTSFAKASLSSYTDRAFSEPDIFTRLSFFHFVYYVISPIILLAYTCQDILPFFDYAEEIPCYHSASPVRNVRSKYIRRAHYVP